MLKKQIASRSAMFLILAAIFACVSQADYRGDITMSDTQIEATDVTYTFNLRFASQITDPNGKLIVRFPQEFEETFTVTGCVAQSGFKSSLTPGSPLFCTWNESVRLLTITQAFPSNIINSLVFDVKGVTNPQFAAQTSPFTVDSYVTTGGEDVSLESSASTITVTPTAGAISNESLVLSNPVVGTYSDLAVSFQAVHAIPSTGQLEVQFPKWNDQSADSYVATSTSPGSVPCKAVANIALVPGRSMDCIFSHGQEDFNGNVQPDILTVNFDGNIVGDLAANTLISFEVSGVRGPPSTAPVAGFSFRTLTKNGDVIDESQTSTINLVAAQPSESTGASMEVSSDDPSINAVSTLNLRIVTNIPLKKDSNLEITIPSDFGVDSITGVSTPGGYLLSNPQWTFNPTTRTLSVQKVNLIYLEQRESIYIIVATVKNPGQTTPTQSFSYQILDPNNYPIQFADKGILFTATAGGFGSIDVEAEDKLINKIDVKYKFTMRTQDLFNNNAVLKIVCPPQVYVTTGASVQSGTQNIVFASGSATTVLFNRIIYVRNAFRSGLSSLQTFEVVISGFTNPPTTQATDSFQVSIIYEQNGSESEISVYKGNSLVIISEPSTALTIGATMTELLTGEMQTEFVISGTMERYNPIEKQAYLQVVIPDAFKIENFDRVASTCTRLTGFSDEVTCSFEAGSPIGHTLVVKGGFDSETFTDREFSFKIAEIFNPLTTQQTDSFEMKIFDRSDGLMYTANNDVKLTALPSSFAFVHVESLNPTNGVEAIYQVTVTLGIETSQGAYLEFTVPDEITFRDTTGASVCRGTQNLAENLSCVYLADNTRRVNLVSDNPMVNTAHQSGTTIQFEIGYLRNPISLKPSSYFYLATYSTFAGKKYLINESKRQVYSTNESPGPILIKKALSSNEELGAQTDLSVQFETQSKIPQSSKLYVTLPANILIESTITQMYLNDFLVGPSINADAKQFVVDGLPFDGVKAFTIRFSDGLTNPTLGPYNFEYLQIEFMDSSAYSIDKRILNEPFIKVPCTNNCDTCQDTLSKCTSCKYNAEQDTSFFLKATEFKCVDECGPGFVEDSGYKCTPCSGNCIECAVSPTSCTLCKPNSVKPYADPQSLRCYDTCPAGTYLDQATTLCTPCVSPCYTCNSREQCTSCDRTDAQNTYVYFFQDQNRCYQDCPIISVPTPAKQCDKCEEPCETCQNLPSQCLSCLEGTFLHKNNECVKECPFLYFENSELRRCTYFGELSLPVPFSIIAFVLTVGVGISAFVKGADRDGREQEGTAFFMTMLALVDMLLRINWAVLAYVVFQQDFFVTFGLLLGLIAISFFVNLFFWRRYFYSKYRYEIDDPLFSAYCNRNPATSNILIFLSYLLSFQTIRLTYSRFLGKKRFMAQFSRRLRYFRLIGRLTVLETLVLYLPAVIINSWSLTQITDSKTSQFWLNVDGLALVCYAVILIAVVLTQREKLMNYKSYFNFSELLKFGDDVDQEVTHETVGNTGQTFPSKQSVRGDAASIVSLPDEQRMEQLEVHSATAQEDLHRQKLYQMEQRGAYDSLVGDEYGPGDDAALENLYKRSSSWNDANRERTVSVIDYQEYRKLEDKRDRIMLKKTLYERKKVGDEDQVVLLNDELNKYQNHKKGLNSRLNNLKKQLKELQKNVVQVDKTRKKEVQEVEQEKRRDIIRRQGREVPYQSHSGITSKSNQREKITKGGQNASNNTNSNMTPRGNNANGRQAKKKRGGQRHQQSKSPNQSMHLTSDQQRQQQQTSPDVLQPGHQISEPSFSNAEGLKEPLDSQVDTEKADNLRRPMVDRDAEQETEPGDVGYPRMAEHASQETQPISPGYPRMNNASQETEPADPGYPRMEIQDTEEAAKMTRPIDTLKTDEVEERVEDAALAGSAKEEDAFDSIKSPELHQSPDVTHKDDGKRADDDDDDWD